MDDFDFNNDDIEFASNNDFENLNYQQQYEDYNNSVNSNYGSENIEEINNYEMPSNNDGVNKKIVIVASIIGFLLIMIGLGGNNLIKNLKLKVSSIDKSKVTSTQPVTQKEENVSSQSSINDPILDYNSNRGTKEENEWIECKINDIISESEPTKAIMTVSEIQTFFKKEGINDTPSIKYIVKGNITGLVGIFEIGVGYNIGSKLTIGQQLNILYNTVIINNQNIVSNIRLIDFN